MSSFTVAGGRPLRGRLRPPGDKSISHRALILGALAEGTSQVRGLSTGDDVARTRAAVEALGAKVEGERITGGRGRLRVPGQPLDLGNSGTSMRLLAGVCATLPGTTILDGDDSLRTRPMDRVAEPLRVMGAVVEGDRPPVSVRGGPLRGIDYRLPVASAQVKGCVLLAGLVAEGETIVRESYPTRTHTEDMLALCGADVAVLEPGVVRVRPSKPEPFELAVPADPSQAAFWIVAACLVPGSDLILEGVHVGPPRGAFLDVLERMGADIQIDRLDAATADVRVRHHRLHGTDVRGAEVPAVIDEIPALAVAAALADGPSVIADAAELALKESDRIATVTTMLTDLGARVEPRPDGLVVAGGSQLSGARVEASGDHRVAMAAAVAAMAAEGTTVIEGWESVATSYPGFESDLETCAS